LITSDSDFEVAARDAGFTSIPPSGTLAGTYNLTHHPGSRGNQDLRRENVSKAFKRMLSQNYQRAGHNLTDGRSHQKPTDKGADSTRSAASKFMPDFEQYTQNSEIESKFAKRSR